MIQDALPGGCGGIQRGSVARAEVALFRLLGLLEVVAKLGQHIWPATICAARLLGKCLINAHLLATTQQSAVLPFHHLSGLRVGLGGGQLAQQVVRLGIEM